MPVEILKTEYGYRYVVTDLADAEEGRRWFAEVRQLTGSGTPYHQIVEVRRSRELSGDHESQAVMREMMEYMKAHGLLRSAMIFPTSLYALKVKQVAFGTPMYDWERYLDGSDPASERRALDWVTRGIDPDNR